MEALSQASAYLVLHLTGERRLYGWAVEWPNTPEHVHFVMAESRHGLRTTRGSRSKVSIGS